MKIIASVPVEKITNGYWSTFRSELRELTVKRVIRSRCDRTRERYYYFADVEDHPDMHPEACRVGSDGLTRVNVIRSQNHGWKPPAFPDGCNVVDV